MFTGSVEHAIAHIEESIQGKVDDRFSCAGTPSRSSSGTTRSSEELKLDEALHHIDQTSRPPRRSWTMTPRASSPTSATSTSHRSSRAAKKKNHGELCRFR